jgi:hypothetical protein
MSTSLSSQALADASWLTRAWSVVSDVVLATAIIWALPLLLAAVTALVRLLT